MTFLEYLKQSPSCLYLYDRSLTMFGIETSDYKHEYLAVVEDTWKIPEEYSSLEKPMSTHRLFDDEKETFLVYTSKQWFDMILNGDIICWECSCSNKKYIIKEHVKILMNWNPLAVRQDVDAMLDPYVLYAASLLNNPDDYSKARLTLFEVVKAIMFANQIINNHKIVNFKECKNAWKRLQVSRGDDILKEFLDIIDKSLILLHDHTEYLRKQEIIKKSQKCAK